MMRSPDPRNPENHPDPRSAPDLQRHDSGSILEDADAQQLAAQWNAIQANFVDDPRAAVSQADRLVEQVFERVMHTFQEHKDELHRQWDAGGQPSTEALRVCLQRYRQFFHRLLDAA